MAAAGADEKVDVRSNGPNGMSITMTRAMDCEAYDRSSALISANGEAQSRFENSQVCYRAPGGHLALFFDNSDIADIDDIMGIGDCNSNLLGFGDMGPTVEMRIELAHRVEAEL